MIYPFIRILKYLLFWLDFLALTIVALLLSFLPVALLRRFYPGLFRAWSRAFVRAMGVNLKLHQKNRKPLPKNYLMIANHPSAFEDVGIPALFPVHSLAKIEVRSWPIFGRISWAAGTLYVHREDKDSRKAAAEQIENEIKNGKNIAVYPEGGCTGRRIFDSFRQGAFDISLKTGIPIVPVFLHYETQEDFEWTDPHTLAHKIWHFMRSANATANYYVYDAIDPAEYEFKDKESYARYVHQLYLDWQKRYLD